MRGLGLGLGLTRGIRTAAVAPATAPSITSSSITGTPEDGQTLTANRSASGNPAPTYAYQWQANGTNIAGETGQTIVLDEAGMSLADGDTISCEITATNSEGSDLAEPTILFVGTPAVAVDAPVLANLSSGWTAGDNPPGWTSTYSNVTPYDTGTGNQVRAVWTFGGVETTEAWQNLDSAALVSGFSWPLLAAADLSAGGAFSVYEEMRYVESDVQTGISAHSNTWSDTLAAGGPVETASSWTTTTGANKSQYVTVSGTGNLTAAGQGGFNSAPISVRATQGRSGKRQFQVTVTTVASAFSRIWLGAGNGSDNLNDNFSVPGKDNSTGIVLSFRADDRIIYAGGAPVQTLGSTSFNANDVLTMEFDTAAGTAAFFHNGTQIGTTITGLGFATMYAFVGFEDAHVAVAKFVSGQSRALSSGYLPYDNL